MRVLDLSVVDAAHSSSPLVAQFALVFDPINPPIRPHPEERAPLGRVPGFQIVGNRPPHSLGTRDSFLLAKVGEAGNLLIG